MKRIMLAAGPWVMNGTDCATRIVAYETKGGREIVVHNQTYCAGKALGQRIEFSSGEYFKVADLCGAMTCWAYRDTNNTQMPEDRPHRYASYDFATEANAADLAQQYYREQQNPPGWNSLDDVPNADHPLNLPELAVNDNAKSIAEARQHWDTVQSCDGCGLALTDDNLLAEHFAERFGVEVKDVYPEYSGDGGE